jgi:iron complex outermembrane receptor protein
MRQGSWLLASAASIGFAAPAFAQSGPLVPADVPPAKAAPSTAEPQEADQAVGDNAAADQEGIADIIVTAQKREQRLRDVPVAVTALTADTLINRGITQVSDVQRAVPSLTVTENVSAQSASINIRGIGTSAFSTGVEPAVLVVVDDVALLQQAQAFSGLTDISRIEVLRGPQGTLFGKAASAGVINIVSQGATKDLTASFGAQATTDEQYRIDGSVSGHVTDWLGVRANAFYDDRRGYIRNLATNHWLGGQKALGARLRVDLKPADILSIALIASYSKDQSKGVNTFRFVDPAARLFPVGPVPGVLIAPSLVGIEVGPDNFRVRQDVEPRFDSRQSMYVARATLDLGFADLISVTSLQNWTFQTIADTDQTDIPVVGLRPGGIYQASQFDARQFAQEFRLVSSGTGPFKYLFGLYYANGETDRAFTRFALGPGFSNWTSEAGTRSYAAFGQATYDITRRTHVDAGIRFNREKIDVKFTNLPLSGGTAANCAITCLGNAADDQVTYKVALRQDITDDVMAYVSYATGYKGQGYDIASGFTSAKAADPVNPEHSKAYEIGLKSAFFNRRVQLSLAGFWTDYRDFQSQAASIDPAGNLVFNLTNVGKLRSKGVEAEISARPVKSLRIDASASYLDATIRSYPGATCYPGQTAAQGCVDINPGTAVTLGQDLAGSRLSNAPRFKYTLSGTYDVALPGMPFNGFLQADYSHQSRVRYDLLGNPRTVQPGYGIFNASIGIEGQGDRGYRVSLFVNNLFDKAYAGTIQNAQGESAGLATTQLLPRNAKRYFGIRARFRY